MTVQEKFKKYSLDSYGPDHNASIAEQAAYLAGAKEAREETIRECAALCTSRMPSEIREDILALLEKQ